MKDTAYASVNTQIRILEANLLNKERYDQLLLSSDFEAAQQVLKATKYSHLDSQFNQELMDHLAQTYAFLYEQVADKRVLEVFSLVYSYHNLKALLKEELAGLSLDQTLLPIGTYSLEVLRHAVLTQEEGSLPSIMLEAIAHTKDHFANYEQVEAIDVLLDRAYFNHLYALVVDLGDQRLQDLVSAWIDAFNVSVIMRTAKKQVSRSFLVSVLAEHGQVPLDKLLSLAMRQKADQASGLLKETSYWQALGSKKAADLTVLEVEALKDKISHYYVSDARYEPFGYWPVLSFIYYTEMDIKNLRLILTGKMNQVDRDLLKERMRPYYDL